MLNVLQGGGFLFFVRSCRLIRRRTDLAGTGCPFRSDSRRVAAARLDGLVQLIYRVGDSGFAASHDYSAGRRRDAGGCRVISLLAELGHYLKELYLIGFTQFAMIILLALFVHTVVGNKFVGHAIVIGFTILIPVLYRYGIENRLTPVW